MNFKYEIYEAPGNAYGFMNKSMEWDGLVKELIDGVTVLNFSLTHSLSLSLTHTCLTFLTPVTLVQ
jgi:hypothetical protein